MTFEVEVSGRTYAISIERTDRPGRFRVAVDGQSHLVDVARSGEFGLCLLSASADNPAVTFSVRGGRENVTVPVSTELYIAPGYASGEVLVTLQGRTIPVTVNGRRTGHAAEIGAHRHGEISIIAPMPGRIVRVLAAPGDDIGARQPVVVVEAMKMENELRAPRAGRVKEISVTPGMSVEAGRVLAVIE
jgi:biotin carboxyl carrier protein